jgi:hypothetical protein
MFEKKKGLKGQAMMEYLMTYGFAIFVIVIVLAILFFYLGNVNTPETCTFDKSNFDCQSTLPAFIAAVGTNNLNVSFKLTNNDQKSVIITRVVCTVAPKAEITPLMGTAVGGVPGITVGPGSSVSAWGVPIPCYDKTGIAPNVFASGPNTYFKGNILVFYKYTDELPGVPLRRANAVVTGKVLQ